MAWILWKTLWLESKLFLDFGQFFFFWHSISPKKYAFVRRPTTIVSERSIFCTIIKEGWKLVFEGYEEAETCFLCARLNFSFHSSKLAKVRQCTLLTWELLLPQKRTPQWRRECWKRLIRRWCRCPHRSGRWTGMVINYSLELYRRHGEH